MSFGTAAVEAAAPDQCKRDSDTGSQRLLARRIEAGRPRPGAAGVRVHDSLSRPCRARHAKLSGKFRKTSTATGGVAMITE